MSGKIWSMVSYLGAVSLMVGGLSACGDTGASTPSFAASTSAQTAASAASEARSAASPTTLIETCMVIPDTVVIHNQAELDAFDSIDCFTVERHLFVQNTSDITNLDALHGLRSVGGYIGISDNLELMTVNLPNLVKTGEGLVFEGNISLQSITADALRYVKGNLHIFGNEVLESVSLDCLISVGEDVIFAGDNSLTSLSLPKLTTIMGQFIFEHSDSLTCLCLPNLVAVNGDFTIHFNPALKSIIAPVLTTIWGDVVIERNATLEVFELPCLQWVAGDMTVIYNHMLAECSVEWTVGDIAYIGGDVVLSANQAICPEVPVTPEDVGCTDCRTNICAAGDCDGDSCSMDCEGDDCYYPEVR